MRDYRRIIKGTKNYMPVKDYIIMDVGFDNILEVRHPSFVYEDEENEAIRHRIQFPSTSENYVLKEWIFEIAFFPKEDNQEPYYKDWDLSEEDKELFKSAIRNILQPEFLIEGCQTMTLAERKQLIDCKVKRDNDKKVSEAARESTAIENYTNQILEWKPRIDELIDLANYARENDISLGKAHIGSNRQCYECGYFYSDGISHLVGFINDPVIKELGIIAGGACGQWNFYTDGEFIYEENGKGEKREPQLSHLEKFVKNFLEFEEEFYKYIDKVCAK